MKKIIIPRDITKADKVFFDMTMMQFISFMFLFFIIYMSIEMNINAFIKWTLVIIEAIGGSIFTWGNVRGISFPNYLYLLVLYATRKKVFVYSSEDKYKFFVKHVLK